MRKPNQRSPLRLLYSAAPGLALSPVIKVPVGAKPPRNLIRRILTRDTGSAIVEQGLGGLPAGSKVLLAIPPLMGYSLNGNPPYVSGADTLVFVIDIVAALGPSR
jgi:hypothetical protein